MLEAWAGAHWIARRVPALGYQAMLISPQFVKPFMQGNKNDFTDALVRDRTATINQTHGFLLEFSISLPKGPAIIKLLLLWLQFAF